MHDIGIQIVKNAQGEVGYRMFVGGGQGRTPMIAPVIRDFLPRRDLLPWLEAALRVYNLHGRRDNKYKARIKILVHEMGAEAYAKEVEEEFARMDREVIAPDQEEIDRIAAYFAPPQWQALPEDSKRLEAGKKADPDFAR